MKSQNNRNNNQKYTSADTSINSKKIPAIYNLVSSKIKPTDQVIDYGCGKYFDNYNLPENFVGYDPYNRDIKEVLNRKYDVALCSNVLNVIMEDEIRSDLLRTLKAIATKVFITIYEGDGDGIGKPTKEDCFQLNRKKRSYLPELISMFGDGNVKYTKGYFECDGEVI